MFQYTYNKVNILIDGQNRKGQQHIIVLYFSMPFLFELS